MQVLFNKSERVNVNSINTFHAIFFNDSYKINPLHLNLSFCYIFNTVLILWAREAGNIPLGKCRSFDVQEMSEIEPISLSHSFSNLATPSISLIQPTSLYLSHPSHKGIISLVTHLYAVAKHRSTLFSKCMIQMFFGNNLFSFLVTTVLHFSVGN
jgi:hypothetical protein